MGAGGTWRRLTTRRILSEGIGGTPLTTGQLWCVVVICVWISCVAPVVADRYCPPITLGNGSPIFPQRTKGGNVTMYRIFHTEGNASLLNFTWVREPSKLSYSAGRYYINTTLSRDAVAASITLWDLMLEPDTGSYTVTACSNCTCNKTTFYLELFKCDPEKLPEPVVEYTKKIVTAKPELSGVLYLYAFFNGSTNTFLYTTDWVHNGEDICVGGMVDDEANFSCNRTFFGNCMFTANLYIYDYNSSDSGNYTVRVIGGASSSRNATIHVDIIDIPEIKSCTPGQLKTHHNGHAEFMCHVSYYSKYDEVIVIEDNHTVYNTSTKNVTFGCVANGPDPSLATCTVNISTSQHSGSLLYKLCVGYNASLQCSDDITITITERSDIWSRLRVGLFAGGGALVLLLVLLLLPLGIIVGCRVHRKRRKEVATFPEQDPCEKSPLLTSGNSTHGDHYDSVDYETLPKTPKTSAVNITSEEEDSNVQKTDVLEVGELVNIAGVISDQWPLLARHLGLTKAAIAAIKQKYPRDDKKQTFEMLSEWYNHQQTPPTKQTLVRIIKEKMKDSAFARDVISIMA